MRILTVGGTGFIGTHLTKYLEELGYPTDNISSREFMAEDFGRVLDFRLEGNGKPDVVIFLAWPRLPNIQDLKHLDFAYMACQFFKFCADNGVRVVNIGSHNEYGVKDVAARENMLCKPVDTYGLAKLTVTLFAQKLGFNTLRLFAVVGEGGRSFPSVLGMSVRYAHPSNAKDFIPVNMVCHSIERIIHAQHLYGEIINVCSGQQQRQGDVVKREATLTEIDVHNLFKRFHRYPQRQYEPRYWYGNPTKMERLLNIYPKYYVKTETD